MKLRTLRALQFTVLFCLILTLHAQSVAPHDVQDTSTHTAQMVSVEDGVKLEVLDWGGTGRPLVLLAGKGFTAHSFDQFALTLTSRYHVYGITRRGYGKSSIPPPTDANYSADRLGDDILAVMDQLKLVRPVLVGHSIAGEELSSIGTREPGKVAGLVYLDAAYSYALYDEATGDFAIDYDTLRRELDGFTALVPMKDRKKILASTADDLSRFEKELAPYSTRFANAPDNAPSPPDTLANRVDVAIFRGEQKFGGVHCPVLAMYASPHSFGNQFKDHPEALKAAQEKDQQEVTIQSDAFSRANPQAVIVKIPNADHFVFRSNEAEVRKAIDDFVANLPK